MNEWQIHIIDPGYKITRDVFIFRRVSDTKTEVLGTGLIDVGDKPNPTLELSPEQLQALTNALNDNGFKPQGGFIEGKLEGTERHLADLRKLLKL